MNILIVGLGSIAQKHIYAIQKVVDEPMIFALRSRSDANVVSGVNNIYAIDDLKQRPDFVIISNPTNLHAKSIMQMISLDCPLFIEKPVLNNLDSIDTINELLAQHQTVTYVACNLRFHPVIQYLRNAIINGCGMINEVNIYCGSYLPEWRPERDYRDIYSANLMMGGGVHLDLVHELDYCYWLFGIPQKINSLKRNVSSLHIDAVDYTQYSLIYSSFVANIVLNYYRRDSRRDIEIVTEKETVKSDLLSCSIISKRTNSILFQQDFTMNETYVSQMKYFIDNIAAGKKPMNDFSEAVTILRMALT